MDFDQIAESCGCDVSQMDGREYETMWCDRAQFEKMCKEIEKRTIERCSELKREALEIFDIPEGMPQDRRDVIEWYDAAIRKLGEQ